MLKVKKLHPNAKLPTVAHPGEDLGYDLYALEGVILAPGQVRKVKTGVSVEATDYYRKPVGLLIRDRSSMAAQGVFTHGGVIDAGYRGEIVVLMSAFAPLSQVTVGVEKKIRAEWENDPIKIEAGQKIAQMIPVPVLTGAVVEVDDLESSSRGENGFGSSGRY